MSPSRMAKFWMLLALAALAPGQLDEQAYFSLGSHRTFGAGEKPEVSVSGHGVDTLEVRVYRVNDPVRFFQQLEDPHQFGGMAPRRAGDRTLLERIRMWKRTLRADIRRSLRGQFTDSPRDQLHLRDAEEGQPAKKAPASQYATAPVLNSQQLVLTLKHPLRARSRWQTEPLAIPVRDRGVYLVEAAHRDLQAYTILMVSDLAMITKTGAGRIVNQVVERASGRPVADADVVAIARRDRVAQARSNADGVAEMAYTAPREDEAILIARRGPDVAVTTVRGGPWGPNGEPWMGYLYTDRPIYRPGHTVKFKGILRLREASGYRVPAGRAVQVQIEDPESKPVFQRTLTATANGTIAGELPLERAAALGHYYIQVKAGEQTMNGHFEVEEYKKPEYEVRVSPAKPRVLQGEKGEARIDARYFFGEPVAHGKVVYSVYESPWWTPMFYSGGEEDPAPRGFEGNEDGGGGEQIEDRQTTLDADGQATIAFPTTESHRRRDAVYRVEVKVTDAANREISGTGWIVATYGSFAVHVEAERYLYAPGERAALRVEARDYDRQPVGTPVRVELTRWRYGKTETVGAATGQTGADGTGRVELAMPREGGVYRARVTARTPEGREVESSSYIWVAGGVSWGEVGRDSSITIVTDKKTYRAGETARLMIVTGRPDTAVLVSIEGRDLRQYKVLHSREATVSYDVPVGVHDEPGVFVSAAFIRDGELFSGSKLVKVPPREHELNVKIATDKPVYQPGQTAEYSIEATGADGRPVSGAEFSLGVVDEAIYGVRRDTTQPILSFFFGEEYNRVPMSSSLEYYFNGDAGKRRMQLAQLKPRSRLAQLKPDRLVQPKVRKAFPDTAFWAADLVTGADGRARAKVEFPDSLTAWRATARGVTNTTQVGAATLKTIVRKNLMMRLAAPRFLIQGDEVVIAGLVHNYLAEAKTVRVSLDAKGVDLIDGGTKDVEVPSRGDAKVEWRVRAQRVRAATFTGKALTNVESDAIEIELPVHPPGVKLAVSQGGSLAAGAAAEFDLTFPEGVEPGSRRLEVRLSPSVAGSLFGALEYLTSFPYGCVEQTMSSFLPNLTVRDAISSLGVKTDLDQAALDEKIRAGMDRLYSFQHEDGGWGWWQTDDSHPFMTAYVVAGLGRAQALGITMRAEAAKGVEWMRSQYARQSPELRAYFAYAAAEAQQPQAAWVDELFIRRADLSLYGLATLGLAMDAAQDARAAAVAAELEARARQNEAEAWWPASRDALLDFDADATPEATAFAAKLLSRRKKDSPLLPKAALWLMNHRNEGYWWSSTKQTAMVIYGLTDYLKASNELAPDFTVTVSVNGREAGAHKMTRDDLVKPVEIALDEAALRPGGNRIRVVTSGAGRLYYSARGEYYSSAPRVQAAGTASLNLLREYYRLRQANEGGKIVYDTVPLDGPVSPGDVVAVRLTVTGTRWKYLLIEDPIPAGTEFLERDQLYDIRNRPPWWQWSFTRRERRDDRMALFETDFGPGQEHYFYLLKVVNPGVFQAGPARVTPMYQPGVLATTESRRLEVK